MKYIIEIEPIYGTDLYRAKGARTLVFDQNGVNQILTPYEEKKLKRWETIKSDEDVRRMFSDKTVSYAIAKRDNCGLYAKDLADYLLEEINAD